MTIYLSLHNVLLPLLLLQQMLFMRQNFPSLLAVISLTFKVTADSRDVYILLNIKRESQAKYYYKDVTFFFDHWKFFFDFVFNVYNFKSGIKWNISWPIDWIILYICGVLSNIECVLPSINITKLSGSGILGTVRVGITIISFQFSAPRL